MLGWGILALIACILIAIWPARIASKKGYSFVLWFLLSIFFWWITLFVTAFVLKDQTRTPEDIAAQEAIDKIA